MSDMWRTTFSLPQMVEDGIEELEIYVGFVYEDQPEGTRSIKDRGIIAVYVGTGGSRDVVENGSNGTGE